MNAMKPTHDLSDELLTRFLSGSAAPEEEERVLDAMASSDEQVDELIQIANGIEVQRRAEAKRHTLWQQPWLRWSAAATLLLLLGLTWFFSARGTQMQMDSAPVLSAQDTLVECDTLTDEMLPCYE